MIDRSRIVLSALLLSTLLLGGPSLTGGNAKPDVTVIYLGADDCPPCRQWSRDYRPRFIASDEFPKLTYREVVAPKLFDLMDNRYWPQDLHGFRQKLDPRSAVPLWFVVVGDRIAVTATGLRQWEDRALPKINSILRNL